ncbi:MAG TPA: DUF5336 domain-containing protein [Mycobacterium sp.]|jgi:hypothetical protein|uniref:DUF5336 domain-containing protein n=1 Tax=Mycobacterium sp. TaxID=1785 RepID=UPI002F3EC4BD
MTYPPGSPGYPPAQSPGSYGAPAAPSFTKADDGESNLKHYLTIAVLALGVIIYLASYAPMITRVLPNGDELVERGSSLPIDLALLAGLLAGVGLLPKAKNFYAVAAVVATLGALLLIEDTIGAPGRGAALWIAVSAGVLQAGLAISALLLDAGVITPPAPRPKYDQYYGQYGYYGQQQSPYQQSGYGTQYGGYPGGPSTGGFSAQPGPQQGSAQAQQHGSPTPPTGFPSFSPPPSSGSGGSGQGNSSDHGGSAHSQHSYGSGQQPQAPSSPSGPAQS